MLRELRLKRDLTQEKVVSAVAALKSEDRYYDERTLRRYESGECRPPRTVLILTLVKVFEKTDPKIVNRVLQIADYATLTLEERSRYGLSQDRLTDAGNTPILHPNRRRRPEPQETLWGPNNGKPAGICITSSAAGEFVPWKILKPEIQTRLFTQLGDHIPLKCTAALGDYKGRPDWLTLIIDPDGKQVGEVWFGTDPDTNWAYDGLVRVGNDTYVVWQVFQRYSDGSYRRIRKQAPRLQRVGVDSSFQAPAIGGTSRIAGSSLRSTSTGLFTGCRAGPAGYVQNTVQP